ncbi:hypothetical protein [Pedobacter ginsengisoli]|uniref:hypothetical protein n=1 Tax=Pedobacter ginsengisoli TaxID=363852 RepID=UPI00254BD47F|nr:hypothetical protein [Pedobacter ginsengisoli]
MKKYLIIPIVFVFLTGCSKKDAVPTSDPEPDPKTLDSIAIDKGDTSEPYIGVTDVYADLDTNSYKDQPRFSGTYKGKLHYRYGNYYVEAVSWVTFQDNKYNSSIGKGTFELKPGNVISFTDHGVYKTDFDWGLILARKYRYFGKGDSLIMTKDLSYQGSGGLPSFYQYRLKLVSTE